MYKYDVRHINVYAFDLSENFQETTKQYEHINILSLFGIYCTCV